jgi:hypothetical protein
VLKGKGLSDTKTLMDYEITGAGVTVSLLKKNAPAAGSSSTGEAEETKVEGEKGGEVKKGNVETESESTLYKSASNAEFWSLVKKAIKGHFESEDDQVKVKTIFMFCSV